MSSESPPTPAYLPTSSSSPLLISKPLYSSIVSAPRVPLATYTLPIRSGLAFSVSAGCIIRISTPFGAQVGDLNLWNLQNPRERFWASRTRQLHASHVSTHDRLWSCLPYMRPLATIIADSLAGYGKDAQGGRVHDLLGTRCDPYIRAVLTQDTETQRADTGEAQVEKGGEYNYHCHSNLVRAILPWGLNEGDVHDVLNLFQVTGLDERGRYWMGKCPAGEEDFLELFAEQDLLMALSTCPGGDLSLWGFGAASDEEMVKCCRPLQVEVFKLADDSFLDKNGWKPAEKAVYRGMHGMIVPQGEKR